MVRTTFSGREIVSVLAVFGYRRVVISIVEEFVEEGDHVTLDLVPNLTNPFERLPVWISECPITMFPAPRRRADVRG